MSATDCISCDYIMIQEDFKRGQLHTGSHAVLIGVIEVFQRFNLLGIQLVEFFTSRNQKQWSYSVDTVQNIE